MELTIDNQAKTKIHLTRCKRPTFRNVRGRTWNRTAIPIIEYDVTTFERIYEVNGWYDTTWGFYMYIHWGNDWYKFDLRKYPIV